MAAPKMGYLLPDEVEKCRTFTLTSGYNSLNTAFVRIKDGYSVGADPAIIKKKNPDGSIFYSTHHVRYEGHVYKCYPGYVMATTKNGMRGWTSWVNSKTPDPQNVGVEKLTIFNPFQGLKVVLETDESNPDKKWNHLKMTAYNLSTGRELKKIKTDLGEWSLKLRDLSLNYHVTSENRFRGMQYILQMLRHLDQGYFAFHFNGKSYNRVLSMEYDYGKIQDVEYRSFEKLMEAHFLKADQKFYARTDTEYGNRTLFYQVEQTWFRVSLDNINSCIDPILFGYAIIDPHTVYQWDHQLPELEEFPLTVFINKD